MKPFLSLLFISHLCIYSFANHHFVSPEGDDNGNGTEQAPYKTLQYAVIHLQKGDTLFLLPGVYKEFLTLDNFSGTAEKPLVITTRESDVHKAIIDGEGVSITYEGVNTDDGALIQIVQTKHLEISNLKIINSIKSGLLCSMSDSIRIKNVSTENTYASGIGAYNCSNITINNCNVVNACQNQEQEFITLLNTNVFEVSFCKVYNTNNISAKEGIDAKDGSTDGRIFSNYVEGLDAPGIYVDAWNKPTGDIDVYNNLVVDCNGIALASEGGGELNGVYVFNNICYNNKDYGIVLGGWGDQSASKRPITNAIIVFNTIIKNGYEGSWGGGISLENNDLDHVVICNNIISENNTFQINNESNLSKEDIFLYGNLVWGELSDINELSTEYSINAAPLLTGAIPYEPTANSPSIDKAAPIDPIPFDFFDNSRPVDGNNDAEINYDIGAIEYIFDSQANGINSINTNRNNTPIIHPNPFTTALTLHADALSVEVYNYVGQQVYSGNSNSINTSDWMPGIYIVKVRTGENTVVQQKCLKQ